MATTEQEVTGTAVATVGPAALPPEQQNEIDRIRAQGQYELARTKEIQIRATRIKGVQWGDVRGESLSPETRHAIAEYCYITGANELVHLHILGGTPYLSVKYYEDLLNQHTHFIGYDQLNISASMSKQLRASAAQARADSAQALKDSELMGSNAELRKAAGDLLAEAYDHESRARQYDLKRAHYDAPDDDASAVYETTIHRYAPWATVEAIRDGNLPENAIQHISECNWAGSKQKDPVGTAHPGLTARSRSFRRTAVKSFSAYMEPQEKRIRRAEKMIEAEFRILGAENGNALSSSGLQALSAGSGEPLAASAENAQPLPVEDRTNLSKGAEPNTDSAGSATAAANAKGPATQVGAPAFDESDSQRAYFATLRDAGINDRKKWQAENGLPESTKDFGQAGYMKAMELLVGPTRKKVEEGASLLGFQNIDELCASWSIPAPKILRDLKELDAAISRELDK